MQALLCWSEYYNGKWQPTKTSDVNQPTRSGRVSRHWTRKFRPLDLRLGTIEGSFGELRFISVLQLPYDDPATGHGSFLLYNTHSASRAQVTTAIRFRWRI